MERRDWILFDCFGLFATDGFVSFFRSIGDENLTLKDSFCVPADQGLITLDEVLTRMAEHLHEDVDSLRKKTTGTVKLNPSMIQLQKELSKFHHTALVSNCMIGTMESVFSHTDFIHGFDRVFLSCDIGLIKPNADYFEYCVKNLGPNPGKIVFFDDNPDNVMGARKTGLDAVLFVSEKQCREELSRRGYVVI